MAILREGRRWAERDFIVHGSRRVTFGAHEAAVHCVAGRLVAHGVRPGDRVALLAANSPGWSVVFFATLQAGAIVVPCNGWWSEAEMAHACALTQPAVVVADERHAGRVPTGTTVLPIEALSESLDGGGNVASFDPPKGTDAVEDEHRPALILFTSGTTGFPKGATLSHRSLVANVQNLLVMSGRLPHQLPDDHPASITLASLPLFHIGAIQLLLVPFVSGARLVFPEGRFSADEVLRLIETEGVTMWSAVPTMVERVLAHPDITRRDVKSLRTVVLGGAAVSSGLLARVAAAFPNAGRGTGQTYGLSEAGGVVSTGVAKTLAGRPGSSGRVAPVVEVRIRDGDEEDRGEILVRSPAVMDGYWGLPRDHALDPEGWLATGDLGRLDDDGFLYITGRLKDMIIRAGENIAPRHVEARLLEHPDVREAAVIGLPHQDLGEEVAAVVVLAPGTMAGAAELEVFAKEALAHFEVPSQWWIRDTELPKNDSGKVLKRVLAEEWSRRG